MGILPYIPSQVMLLEHHRNVTRNMPNPDWPPARRVQTPPRLAAVRRRVSDGPETVADRLDPSGSSPQSVQLVALPFPGTGRHPSHVARRETHR